MHASANRDQRYGARHPVGLCLTLNQPKGTGQQFRFIYDVAVMVVAELVSKLSSRTERAWVRGLRAYYHSCLGGSPYPDVCCNQILELLPHERLHVGQLGATWTREAWTIFEYFVSHKLFSY